jgi:hypothetical protein
MVLLVGSFYVIIMLLTQIISNSFLFEYSGYYLLNIIPFVVIYFLNKNQIKKGFTKINTLDPPSLSNDKAKKYTNAKLYIFYALILSISSFTICFPLNTYILNEELYGYLLYQNLVPKVYVQLFGDYFVIIISLSMIGGLLGLGMGMGTSVASKYNLVQFRQYFTEHRHGDGGK